MHEMSIALSILRTLKEEMAKHPGCALRKAKLGIGEFSGVEVESLRFSLELALAEEGWAGLELDIAKTPLRAKCRNCGCAFKPEATGFLCECCGSDDLDIEAGQSVTVDSITIE